MLRYTTDRARPGLVALYDIRSGNGVGQFLQPWSPHEAIVYERYGINCREKNGGYCGISKSLTQSISFAGSLRKVWSKSGMVGLK